MIGSISTLANDSDSQFDSAAIALCSQPYGAWRQAWDIELFAFGNDSLAFPDSVAATISNRSDDVIEGSNPVFNLIVEGGFFGWCSIENALQTTVRLEPGEKTALVFDLNKLSYKRYDDSVFPASAIVESLKSKPWKIQLNISDHLCAKPPNESNWNVMSDWLKFGTRD